MNPVLLSENVSRVLLAVMAAAALAHLWLAARSERRLSHGLHAATAAGLLYLLGGRALGWDFLPREALCLFFAALFALAALAVWRGQERVAAMIEPSAMAYVFAPLDYWRPPVSAVLLLYFLWTLIGWLQGAEAPVEENGADHRPPLFPPKRARGLRELAGAAVAGTLVYVFALGVVRAPVAAPPQEQAAPAADAESHAEETPPAEAQTVRAQEPEAPAPAPVIYKAKAGETLTSIARKLYGKADRLPALLAVNPGLKPAARLKAGQAIHLPAGR